jgi:uncharacterized repeat protein (TIGR03803 family)
MDSKGNLYGTTNKGGANNEGMVFEVSPQPAGGCPTGSNPGDGWCEKVLYSFGQSGDGTYPDADLILHSGALYGTTFAGGNGLGDNYCGSGGCGTVFKLSRKPAKGCASGSNTGNGWCETVLYSLGGQPDGFGAYAGLITDTEGNFYGTTLYGGNGVGTVFKLSPEPARGCAAGSNTGNGWCETVLYSFGNEPDGQNPQGGVIRDSKGNLYGTTVYGGINPGTVFKLSPEPASGCASGSNTGNGWCETVLYRFGSQSGDGSNPYGGLVTDGRGNLYGTTSRYGANTWGTVFEVTPTGVETTLHSFGAPPLGADDGCGPLDHLLRDSKGNLYGTTNACGALDGGIAFELSPPHTKGAAWTYTVLHDFNGIDGRDASAPQAGLIMDKNGNLYGTTDLGGASGVGTVFEITP